MTTTHQTPATRPTPDCPAPVPDRISPAPPGKCDPRLPHEIAATILTAAYEVMAKKLAYDRETGR
jgi:hypothetical protein